MIGQLRPAPPLMSPMAYRPPVAPPVAPTGGSVGLRSIAWDPLGELVFTVAASPVAAALGAGLGYLVGGVRGAAKGALVGATAVGGFCAGRELLLHPFWRPGPNSTGGTVVAIMAAFPALGAVGWAVGGSFGGPVGAAWGAFAGVVAPIAVWAVSVALVSWLQPPTPIYPTPVPVPVPTAGIR